MYNDNVKFQTSRGPQRYCGCVRFSRYMEIPVVMVYLIIILSITMKYLFLKPIHTHCSSGVESVGCKCQLWHDVSCDYYVVGAFFRRPLCGSIHQRRSVVSRRNYRHNYWVWRGQNRCSICRLRKLRLCQSDAVGLHLILIFFAMFCTLRKKWTCSSLLAA